MRSTRILQDHSTDRVTVQPIEPTEFQNISNNMYEYFKSLLGLLLFQYCKILICLLFSFIVAFKICSNQTIRNLSTSIIIAFKIRHYLPNHMIFKSHTKEKVKCSKLNSARVYIQISFSKIDNTLSTNK